MLNLDTHILLLGLQGTLTKDEANLLRGSETCVSSIVLWEIAKLHQLGRIPCGLDDPVLAGALSRCRVFEIDGEVGRASTRLDFRSDPADEIIAGTSLAHGIPLLTRDARIRASRVVPLALP